MFSPLARGKAGWDGELHCEEFSDQTSPLEPLLPQLLNHTSPRNKSAKSTGSFLLEDGQLALPKTFVTRKGGIILFTPSEEICHHGNGESHLKKENVYEAGLRLRTLGNLANSVLQFGKEGEEAWEGILDSPKGPSDKESSQKRDKTSFLRFLHYLDSENLTADKHVQPGADPEYYLEELKKSSGHHSHRRYRSQTPFSTRTSYSTNTASHYSHFLEDDEEITGIIQDYMKYGRPGWGQNKEHLEHRVVSSDHMPDIGVEGPENLEDVSSFSSPRSPRTYRSHTSMFSPSMSSMGYGSTLYEDLTTRPKTAPIPPSLESPKANPRITSAKPPPHPRALGSKPNHLDEIINADVGFGRYQRRGPSPRLRHSRSPSPSFHLGSSRGATPDCSKVQRLASPDGKSEDWNRATNVIEEEDEASLPADQVGSENSSRRPSSAGSLRSGREEKVDVQRRASSAGTANRRTRSSFHSSRSGSLSSVSHYNRGPSARSRDHDFFVPADAAEFDEMEREETSPTWPGVSDELCMLHDEPDDHAESTWQVPEDIAGSRTASPSRDNAAKSPSPPSRSTSVASRAASASSRSHSVQSNREKVARSRGSTAASSTASGQWEEAIQAADEAHERKSSSSSRGRIVVSRESNRQEEETHVEDDTRTSSAKSAQGGAETKATLGSEADLAQVSQTVVRSQSVAEGVYEDMLDEEQTADQEWPGVMEEVYEPNEKSHSDDEDSITQELASSSPGGVIEEEFQPVPSVSVEERSSPGFIQPVTPPPTEYDEQQQESQMAELHQDEAITSIPSTPELHENEAAPSVTKPVEFEETGIVSPEPSPPVTLETPESAISDDVAIDVQDYEPSTPAQTNLPIHVQEHQESTLIAPEQQPAPRATEVPRASSPVPIKADQILHKELLADTGLEVKGKMDVIRPSSPYKEMIDIEKSRPSSPVTEEERNIPVSIGEAVRTYIETGQEPQIRDRSARSRRGSETGAQEKENEKKASEKSSSSSMEGEAKIRPKPKPDAVKPEAAKTTVNRTAKPAPSSLSEKPKGLPAGKKPDLPGLSLVKSDEKTKEVKEPTDEEREARRQMVSSLLSKREEPKDGKLELEGIGKEGEEGESTSVGLVTRASPPVAEKKNDLSDLAALVSKNKTPSKPKEKKPDMKKKSGKPTKSAKKKDESPIIDPENIDFDAFNTPEMLEGMDDELRQFIQEQSKSDVTSAAVNQPSEDAVVDKAVKRQESVQIMEMPQVAPEVPPEKKDAYAPSKPKKMTKKELAKLRADQRKEERKRKEEEKRIREEEMRLLKEREEEAARAKAEAEEKQKNIEEEKMKRMEEEEEAKRQEQEAMERLKDAKKKAREERETRRAAEAERRRLEVQKKREEKKKREEDLREREKELEQQRMNREKRMAEIEEARRRKEELERLEDEQRREEERLLALQQEEEERRLEEEKIREAEEELRRIQEEREYREQMRRIAEMQEAKLRQEEEERLRREEEERQRAEEERRKREEAEQERVREEQRRIEMARRLEALARMRSAQAAARRKALLLKRREDNVERFQNLKHTRCGQGITRAFVFTYYTHIPRKVWEVPIGFNKKKKGFGSPRRKPAPPKPP